MAASWDLEHLNESSPERFYMPNQDMVDISDTVVVAKGGQRLPAHSAFLADASPVLLACFTMTKRKLETMIVQPFSDFSVQETAIFLRLAVRMEEATDSNLKQLPRELFCGVLRLAHALNAQRIFRAMLGYVSRPRSPVSLDVVVDVLNIADSSHMDDVKHSLMLKLADRLTSSSEDFAACARLSPGIIPQLLQWTVSGVKEVEYVYQLPNFSSLSGKQHSSEFYAAGFKWRLTVYPTGNSVTTTHMSVYLNCRSPKDKLPVSVRRAFEVHRQGRDPYRQCVEHTFTDSGRAKGTELIRLQALRDDGYLEGDVLRLTVKVSLIPPPADSDDEDDDD